MRERLTWNQICARHPDRWVVLVDTEWTNDDDFEFDNTHVAGVFTARADAAPMIQALYADGCDEVGSFWTGEAVPRGYVSENLLLAL